ncbi:ThuA domain-containing protein [Microlunatus endophyticus]|uniref:ThuA domain-containing protein n=1 Tax=Microlunatus endophyticus TaxID=1716077 RepID=UPI001664CF67|nr:ThuA domain-containing protein [Microlunatus endophyticus]
MSAVLVSGGGRYADRWHDYAATSAELAGLLSEAGVQTAIMDDVDAALAGLDQGTDLLIVNAGECADPDHGDPAPAARQRLRRYLASRRPVLALHSAASAFTDVPEWEAAIGARWIPGTTWHPEHGPATIEVRTGHPIVDGADDFVIVDERYTDLRVADWVDASALHRLDGVVHPLIWAAEADGRRVVYDALGHDVHSIRTPDHRAFLERAVRWLTT